MAGRSRGVSTDADVKARLLELFDDVFAHDGYGQIVVDVRILRRGQKEVVLRCGKEYRFVVDFPSPAGPGVPLGRGGCTEVDAATV